MDSTYSNPRNKTNVSPRLESRLVAYAAVAAAALATPVLPSAGATVINSGVLNIPIPANLDGIYIDFLTGVTGTAGFTGWDWNPYLSDDGLTFFWNISPSPGSAGVSVANGGPYLSLHLGDVVSSASNFNAFSFSDPDNAAAAFHVTGTEILGFRFRNEKTAATNYGYLVITTTGPNGFPATLVSYSYEDSGGAITVVPEPSTFALLGLMAVGALGVRAWRLLKALG